MGPMNKKVNVSTVIATNAFTAGNLNGGVPLRYRFCWWCSRKLQGNHHRKMRSTIEAAGTEPVIVHKVCSESMQREGGWEDVRDRDAIAA